MAQGTQSSQNNTQGNNTGGLSGNVHHSERIQGMQTGDIDGVFKGSVSSVHLPDNLDTSQMTPPAQSPDSSAE